VSIISHPKSISTPPKNTHHFVSRPNLQVLSYRPGEMHLERITATTIKSPSSPHTNQSPEPHSPPPPKSVNTLPFPRWLPSRLRTPNAGCDLLRNGDACPLFADDIPHTPHDTLVGSHRDHGLDLLRCRKRRHPCSCCRSG